MEGWKVRGLLGLALAICISYSVLPAQAQERVGVTAAVNLDAEGQAPSKPVEKLVLGHNVVHNERISTLDKGQVQIQFVDESTISLAPNSEIIIDEFVYDPNKQVGKMTATVTAGLLRFVGGKISKQSDAVNFATPSGNVAVRGGVAIIEVKRNTTASSGARTQPR
ncbi:MAG: FecR domain-containing protein [Alphaproteobacteria bacterium]|jgi:trimeric autotransporter adhesin|nr:MAG: FecR domain-containing protein [Alphaproteobacteria bacterium]